jgi:hypothetical protein
MNMKRIKMLPTGLIAMGLGLSSPAQAMDWWVNGHVTQVEASYLPNSVDFSLDAPAGNCAAGQLLTWNAVGSDVATQAANVQGVLSLLISAQLSGHSIKIAGFNNGCVIQYIYIV